MQMLLVLRMFLVVFLLYHILVTSLGYGIFDGAFPQLPALIRDWIWILFFWYSLLSSISSFVGYRKRWKMLRIVFFLLLWSSLFFSYIQDKSFYDMFVGFKYGFYYIFLFLSATFIGHSLFHLGTKKQVSTIHHTIKKFVDGFVWILVALVGFWFLWQWAKLLFPDFFFWLWYGALNDFYFGANPPLYYLTWFEGTLRWQWIFAGPNNYWYFLVAFFPLILSYFKFSFSSLQTFFLKKTNLISLGVYFLWFAAILATLSRSALLGILVIFLLRNIRRWKRHWKVSILIFIVVLLWILGLSFLKESSTLAHITAKFSSIQYVLSKPLWYWLGSSWPAIHHNGQILPENYFIQILIDIGILWFALFVWRYVLCRKKLKLLLSLEWFGITIRAFLIGWIALLSMGIFLHVFEDSMVNYSFFVFFWLLVGYVSIEKKTSLSS